MPEPRVTSGPGFAGQLAGDIARIWRTPHRYDAFPEYLVERGLMSVTRVAVVLAILVIGTQPLFFELGFGANAERSALLVAAVVAGIDLAWATLFWRANPWLGRWPSLLFVATTCVFMAKTAYMMSIPYLGLAECTGYAAICGYVVFFHGPRVFAAVTGVALVAIAAVAVREVADGASPVQVVSLSATVLVIVGTVPVMTLLVTSLLTADAEASGVDGLTETLNRRGLDNELRRMTRDGAEGFTAFVLDLDSFKSINDTHGHATGDTVLVSVAKSLREAIPGAAVARLGGEEFVVVLVGCDSDPTAAAEQLRLAVRTSSTPRVTASIGTASLTMSSNTETDVALAGVDRMLTAADHAMYRAKKAGGDRAHAASPEVS